MTTYEDYLRFINNINLTIPQPPLEAPLEKQATEVFIYIQLTVPS
jgi:hypothetical protein